LLKAKQLMLADENYADVVAEHGRNFNPRIALMNANFFTAETQRCYPHGALAKRWVAKKLTADEHRVGICK
jgi:hypothetical protein